MHSVIMRNDEFTFTNVLDNAVVTSYDSRGKVVVYGCPLTYVLPASAPYISQLPVAVQFSDGNPMAPLVYRERLTPDIQQGYLACQSKPQSKIRRQLK